MSKSRPNLNNMPDDWNDNNMQRERLSGGIFQNYNLAKISLNGADMSSADFTATNFQKAQLRGVNLSNTVLCGTNLSSADLTGADLSGADLRGANLTGANLSNTNLSEVELSGAYLRDAKFIGCHGIEESVIQSLKQHKAIVEQTSNLPHSQDDKQQWRVQIIVPIVVALITSCGLIIANIWKSQPSVQTTTIEQHK